MQRQANGQQVCKIRSECAAGARRIGIGHIYTQGRCGFWRIKRSPPIAIMAAVGGIVNDLTVGNQQHS